MTQTSIANPGGPMQVPTSTLATATAGALAAAAAILVLFVLPAEYGIDPTGVGGMTGIVGMGAGSSEATASAEVSAAPMSGASVPDKASIVREGDLRSDELTLTLEPHSGREVKAHMRAGQSYVFEWSAKGGPVKAEMHGEKTNAPEGEFTSYWKEMALTGGKGSFTAPFDGTHGWYFRNKGETPVTITVRTTGFYKDLFLPQG
jgi:hypothetical protein